MPTVTDKSAYSPICACSYDGIGRSLLGMGQLRAGWKELREWGLAQLHRTDHPITATLAFVLEEAIPLCVDLLPCQKGGHLEGLLFLCQRLTAFFLPRGKRHGFRAQLMYFCAMLERVCQDPSEPVYRLFQQVLPALSDAHIETWFAIISQHMR